MKLPLLGALASVVLASFARPASASATFPEALRSKLDLAQVVGPAPGCRLCHQDDLGGLKTATKPFGRSLLKAGAAGASVPSLLAALDSLQAQGTDSDRDGTADIAELEAGTDPNVTLTTPGSPSPGDDIPLPETGCGLVRASSVSSASAALLGVVLCLLRRSRRRD